ncbi:AMP-binding protein [Kocuria carniphila]|uniref:AMP-binding protein n=1 Tax=Kocuria carniphila TaxID=262208 RepID=UPI0034CD0EC0
MYDFARWIEEEHDCELPDFAALHSWSVESSSEFWQGIWDYFGVVSSSSAHQPMSDEGMPGTHWFPGATLNYAENSLSAAATRPDEVAIIGEHETGQPQILTWSQLEAQVASVASWLRDLGIGPGDRVAGVLPNIPQTAVALLAAASVGAVWSVVNTDFGPGGEWRIASPRSSPRSCSLWTGTNSVANSAT